MKTLPLALTLLITLSAHTCKDSAGNSMTDLLDKKWVFQTVNGEKVSMPDGVDTPWIQLAGEQLTGFGGCNSMMGSYKLGDGAISFPGLGSTKKYCQDVQPTENAIKGALAQVQSFKMDGGLLKLLGSAGEVATLRAE